MTHRRILVIENDKILTEVVEDYFSRIDPRFEVVSADSVVQGAALIRAVPVDLVICSHQGPGKYDGLELLRILHKLDIVAQVILLTDKSFISDRNTALELGCTNFLTVPYSFPKLCELINNMQQPSQGFSGRLLGIKLEDIIQMFCYRKDSTLLSVSNGGVWGSIYVHDGGIVHAECEDLTGVEAFYEILGWEKGKFLSQIVLNVPKQTLFMDWQSLLMEGLRQKDEIRHALAPVGEQASDSAHVKIPASASEPQKRIMIVDDSRFIRKIVYEILQSDPGITVIGYASNGQEALAKMDELKPDLILLDWDMPVMKGSTTLMHIMIRSACPVVVLSGFLGGVGANPFDLLCLGGVDFLRKPQNNWRIDGRADDLVYRIKEAGRIQPHRIRRIKIPSPVNLNVAPSSDAPANILTVIYTATGGSADLIRLVSSLPENWPGAILIIHDMQTEAIGAFIEYLDRRSQIHVRRLEPDDPLLNSHVYVHPAAMPAELVSDSGTLKIKLAPHIHKRQSIDHLLTSAAHVLGSEMIAALLSGGDDGGLSGSKFVRDLGGRVIVLDPEASVDPRLSEAVLRENLADATCRQNNLVEILQSFISDTSHQGLTGAQS